MEIEGGFIKGLISFLLVGALLVGAYFLLNRGDFSLFTKIDDNKKDIKKVDNPIKVNEDIKIDKDKDLIYFETVEIVSLDLDIVHKYPIININTDQARNIEAKIKSSVTALENTTIFAELEEEIAVCEYKIKEVKEIRYEIFEYKNYLSLVVYEGIYSCMNDGSENIVSSYTFDITTGKLIAEKELLEKYSTNLTDIKSEINNVLQTKLNEIVKNDESLSDFIEINNTINNLKTNETFIIYINNKGKLEMNFVVITKLVNYNETIEFN